MKLLYVSVKFSETALDQTPHLGKFYEKFMRSFFSYMRILPDHFIPHHEHLSHILITYVLKQ